MNASRTFTVEELRTATTHRRQEPLRILDLYCGGGGVAIGLSHLLSSFTGSYLGVDIEDRSDVYPGEFIQTDASTLTLTDLDLHEPVDLVWASPPCQAYSKLSHIWHDDPKEVHPTFDELNVHDVCKRLGNEYIIENVVGCDDLVDPITLNGHAFGLDVTFTRKFETSFPVDTLTAPSNPDALTIGEDNEKDIAKAKHVPTHWSKQEIRSAMPRHYVAYLLSHCPSLPEIHPPGDPDCTMYREFQSPDNQTNLTQYRD